jgi:hypothetical protein
MFPDSLANMWAFSRQPCRGLSKTEVQYRIYFPFFLSFWGEGGGGIIQKKVEACCECYSSQKLTKIIKMEL